MQESVLLAVSSRKWTAFGSETDSVSDECNSSTAGQFHFQLLLLSSHVISMSVTVDVLRSREREVMISRNLVEEEY